MSLSTRLADAAETEAGISNSGSALERTTLALESIAGVTNGGKGWADRIRLASFAIAGDDAVTTGSHFVNAALNLEIAADVAWTMATPLERMILAIQEGFTS